MFDPEQELMQRWDTRQTLDQLNGYLAAFAHLNSALLDRGNEAHVCDATLREIPITGDLKKSVTDWLRPIFSANKRSIRKLEVETAESPKVLLHSTLKAWLFRRLQAPSGYDRDEVCRYTQWADSRHSPLVHGRVRHNQAARSR